MGYKGVDTTELIMEDLRIPADRVLGGTTGRGFYQMMDGVEVGRVNVAARGCGVAQRAFELGIDYAQQRHTFGKPIASTRPSSSSSRRWRQRSRRHTR